MSQRLQLFTKAELDAIHQASLEILISCGVEFPSRKTRTLFQEHAFRVEGEKVFITEEQLKKALSTAPTKIKLHARNPQNNLSLGGDDYVLAVSGGAPNYIDSEGQIQPGTLAVYKDFCKMSQTSDFITPAPHACCYPYDVSLNVAYLHMLLSDITLTDRVLEANSSNEEHTLESIEIASLVFGGKDKLKKEPALIGFINPCSPLKYAYDQSEALMTLSRHNQPLTITNMMMLGTTAPISIPSALAVSNAELLAGVVLTQLAHPGAGIIYGTTSCPTDMKSMVGILGAPETLLLSRGAIALADYYNLPCRTGGSLTDSHLPDAQAMIDGSLVFQNALQGGAHFIFHAFGMMSSYLAVSLEKMALDEEMIRMLTASLKLPAINNETIDLDFIKGVGHGNYLTQPQTAKSFRNIFRSKFLNRQGPEQWRDNGAKSASLAAKAEVARRLAAYEKPPIDPKLEAEVAAYIKRAIAKSE